MTALFLLSVALAAPKASIHRISTDDGMDLGVSRYENPGKPPVVLVHGISCNHRFWDLEADQSLALALWDAGFDVWNLDLRGHGLSLKGKNGRQRPTSIDVYGEQDLPAAFAYIQGNTGVEDLHYIGHSMGGMVLAVYLANTPDPPLASAIVVASPLDLGDPDPLIGVVLHNTWLGTLLPSLPTPAGARLVGHLGEHSPLQIDQLLYNPENVDRHTQKLAMKTIVSPVWRGESRQFGLAKHGKFLDAEGAQDYRERLSHIKVPMLFFAGRADRIVHPDRVRTYYDAIGSHEKGWVLVSKANGFTGNYGHLDFGLAESATTEIFPRMIEWLQNHP